MDENLINEPNQNLRVDPERIKYIAGIINKTIIDLKNSKQKADDAWNGCYSSLGEDVTRDINERRVLINKKFEDAINNLEKEAQVLDSVANIWNETEVEIMSSSKKVDEMFDNLNKSISFFFNNNESNNNENNDKQ